MTENIELQIIELNSDIIRNAEDYNNGSLSEEEYKNLQNELIDKREKLYNQL